MPIYVYWGEDDFAIEKAQGLLRSSILDPNWISFNYTIISPDEAEAPILGLNQVMTPVFGAGGRLVWLANTTLFQNCPENVLSELVRTLPVIPENSYLLLSSRNKPDERLKSTKLLKQYAKEFREFPLVSMWNQELLLQSVKEAAEIVGVKLSAKCAELVADSVGNDTRLLYNELEKLRLYTQGSDQPLEVDIVAQLVRNTTHNSLELADAILAGNTAKALASLASLMNQGEPGLRIVATLISRFRTWLLLKVTIESGERNQSALAAAAEINNPKRIYYLQQEIKSVSLPQLLSTLPLLLELEVSLKQGASQMSVLQTKLIELCQLYRH